MSEKKNGSAKISSALVFREYLESLSVAILLAIFVRIFILSVYKIPTGSMAPALKVGDFIFGYKLSYGISIPFSGTQKFAVENPKRGDVVVFRYPSRDKINYVKRVVGLAGDRIEIKNRILYVNEQAATYTEAPRESIQDMPNEEMYDVREEISFGVKRVVIFSKAVAGEDFGPVIVPPNHVFVLGDNRDSSDDSRYWGAVPLSNVEGRVFMIWMSLDWQKRSLGDRFPGVRWGRLFTWL